MFGRDFSPLLSSLGIVAVAGAVAPACRDDEGPPPIETVSDALGVYEDIYAFYCECYGEFYDYGENGTEECLSELDVASEGEQACMTEVFDANPVDFEVFKCQAESLRGYFSCFRADGCPESFTCDDGEVVPESAVCDGFESCTDGSDEQQDCPPPFMCGDGIQLSEFSICDGFMDCPDGEDEADCPEPFVCGDGTEIPAEWICDDDLDCEDGSDEEQNCPVTCEGRYAKLYDECGEMSDAVQDALSMCFGFRCFDGVTELEPGQQCDGNVDCPDGSDEEFCEPSSTTGVGGEGGTGAGTADGTGG